MTYLKTVKIEVAKIRLMNTIQHALLFNIFKVTKFAVAAARIKCNTFITENDKILHPPKWPAMQLYLHVNLYKMVDCSTLMKHFKNHVIVEEKATKYRTRPVNLNYCESTFKIYSRFRHLKGLADSICRHISKAFDSSSYFHLNDTMVNEKIIDM